MQFLKAQTVHPPALLSKNPFPLASCFHQVMFYDYPHRYQ